MKALFSPVYLRVFAIGGALAFATSMIVGAWFYGIAFGADAPPSGTARAISIDLALFTAFALHHSVFARAGLKRMVRIRVGTEAERSVYVWIASVLFALMVVLWQPVAGIQWDANTPVGWLLAALQFVGAAVMIVAGRVTGVRDVAGLGTLGESDPMTRGLKTAGSIKGPFDRGPYSVIRHPLYLAVLLLLWPMRLMTGTRLLFAGLFTLYVILAIPLEEQDLRRAFGDGYGRYAQRVRFRLIPFIY